MGGRKVRRADEAQPRGGQDVNSRNDRGLGDRAANSFPGHHLNFFSLLCARDSHAAAAASSLQKRPLARASAAKCAIPHSGTTFILPRYE